MTENQIKALKNQLYTKYYGDNCIIPEGLKMPITKEDQITFKKLDIRQMMLSCLTYGENYFDMVQSSWYTANRNKYDWEELEALGVEDGLGEVHNLWDEMKTDFKNKACVVNDVYTDSEGVSYNSVTWVDDK